MAKTIGISEFRNNIAERIRDVSDNRSRYLILQRSQARAVLIHPDELEALEKAAAAGNGRIFKKVRVAAPRRRLTSYEDFFGKKRLKP